MFFGRRRLDDDPLTDPPSTWAPDHDQWLSAGQRMGYCSEPACITHDGLPMTAEEAEAGEDAYWGDDCVHAVRLWEDGQP